MIRIIADAIRASAVTTITATQFTSGREARVNSPVSASWSFSKTSATSNITAPQPKRPATGYAQGKLTLPFFIAMRLGYAIRKSMREPI